MGSRNSSGISPSSSALSCADSRSAVKRRSEARPTAAFSPAISALQSQPNVQMNLQSKQHTGVSLAQQTCKFQTLDTYVGFAHLKLSNATDACRQHVCSSE